MKGREDRVSRGESLELKMTKELSAKVERGQASADALTGGGRWKSRCWKYGSHALFITTNAWSIYFLFGQNIGSTHIPTLLPFLFSSHDYLTSSAKGKLWVVCCQGRGGKVEKVGRHQRCCYPRCFV